MKKIKEMEINYKTKKSNKKQKKQRREKTNYMVEEKDLYKYNDLYADIGGGE